MSKELVEVVVTTVVPSGRRNLLFELRLPDHGPLPPFQAGAHIDVHLKNGLIRQYSLCGNPLNSDFYQLCIHLDEKSRGGSAAMHREVNVGQRLLISHPRNNFPLPPSVRYLMFAGGIGITPLLPMVETVHRLGIPFELHYYTAHEEEKALTDRLMALNGAPNIFFHASAAGSSLRHKLPECLHHPDNQTVILTCGPSGFMKHLKEAAAALGWQRSQFYSEQFRNHELFTGTRPANADKPQPPDTDAAKNTNADTAQPHNAVARKNADAATNADKNTDAAPNAPPETFSVRIASTGKTYTIGRNETIAQVLTANGVSVELSCEQGMCGACLTRVLSGIPDHQDIVQSDQERALNDHMTLCCSRSLSDLLILDL